MSSVSQWGKILHLSSSQNYRRNKFWNMALLKENIPDKSIHVVGNTVIVPSGISARVVHKSQIISAKSQSETKLF